MAALPESHHALVQRIYAEPLNVEQVPVPKVTPGAAIIKVEAANVVSYIGNVYNGTRKYSYPTPLVTGTSSIGRVAAVGPDAALLQPGDLVIVDITIHARDDPGVIILQGVIDGQTAASRKLMEGEWRDSSYAEYVKVPLENCVPLNEAKLCSPVSEGGLGYKIQQLAWFSQPLVPYGGFKSINLQAGETVIVSPATGAFGGAAVLVALAMGARVIAMGRNTDALAKIKEYGAGRVETVQIVNDVEKELAELKKYGPASAYLDISPNAAANSTHFKSAILSLAPEGRVSLMGGLTEFTIPHIFVMRHNITLKGKFMYYREDTLALTKLIENGNLRLDHVRIVGEYPLEQWKEAFDSAAKHTGLGELTLLKPSY